MNNIQFIIHKDMQVKRTTTRTHNLNNQVNTNWSSDSIMNDINKSRRNGTPLLAALLEQVGKWSITEEIYKGQQYRYLIGGEAFDWKLLIYRIMDVILGQVVLDIGTIHQTCQ